jgi:hypothetical protein
MASLCSDLFVVFQKYQGHRLGGVKRRFAFIDEFRSLLRDRLFGMG